jgi:hypothetical protein
VSAGDPWQDTGNSRRSTPNIGPWTRALAMGGRIEGTPIGSPRWTPPPRPYVYRGTGRDELTPWIDDLPEWTWGTQLTRRQERMEALAQMPLWTGASHEVPPGYVTAAQAAEQLGVSTRTVERYKRDMAARRAS